MFIMQNKKNVRELNYQNWKGNINTKWESWERLDHHKTTCS